MGTGLSFSERFAEALKGWVPALEGRVLAVSEVDVITKDNLVSLPVALVGVVRDNYENFPTVRTDFVVEVLLEPVREKRVDGKDTPFWSYYNTEPLVDAIIMGTRSEQGLDEFGSVNLETVTVEATKLAVIVSMTFFRLSRWCEPEKESGCGPELVLQTGPLFTLKVQPVTSNKCQDKENCAND